MATSTELKDAGNELYKSGKLEEAIDQYLAALRISNDSSETAVLHSNVSSARFEQGDYKACLSAIFSAFQCGIENERKQRQLKLRELKCHFHLGNFSEVDQLAEKLLKTPGSKDEIRLLQRSARFHATARDKKLASRPSASHLPLYRPSVTHDRPFFWRYGGDVAEPVLTVEQLLKRGQGPVDLDVFYAGVNDARHFYTTLCHFSLFNEDRKRVNGQRPDKLSFLLVDISMHTAARTMIILRCFHLIGNISTRLTGKAAKEKEEATLLALVWYIYACEIMPRRIHERLFAIMKELKGDEAFDSIPWLTVGRDTRKAIRLAIDEWLGLSKDTHKVLLAYDKLGLKGPTSLMGKQPVLSKIYKELGPIHDFEQEMFYKTLITIPVDSLLKDEPELSKMIKAYKSSNGSDSTCLDLMKYTVFNWRTNVTLFDPGREADYMYPPKLLSAYAIWLYSSLIDFSMNVYLNRVIAKRKAENKLGDKGVLMGWAFSIFRGCAAVLSNPETEVRVEYRVAEMNATLDAVASANRGSQSPLLFDAMFLSNIPDYTGSYATIAVHANPLLKDENSYIHVSMARNGPLFEGLAPVMAEYVCLPSIDALEVHLGLKMAPKETQLSHTHGDGWSFEDKMESDFKLAWPIRWQKSPLTNVTKHVSKGEFQTWLHRLFFKYAVQVSTISNEEHRKDVFAPCTLQTWIRLLDYVITYRGFPAHWVSSVVETVLSGCIKTTARPAVTVPLQLEELTRSHPETYFSTKPWVPELRRLLATQDHPLPFSVNIPKPLPLPGEIGRYEIKFFIFDRKSSDSDCLGMLFTSKDLVEDRDFPEIVRGERTETVNMLQEMQKSPGLHPKELIVALSSFEFDGVPYANCITMAWDPDKAKPIAARFYLERSVFTELKNLNYVATLIRNDTWGSVLNNMGTSMKDAVEIQ